MPKAKGNTNVAGHPSDYFPDIDEWPDDWMGIEEDVEIGRGLLALFIPYIRNYPGQFSLYHAPLSSAMSRFGSAARVSSIFQPCFFAVERSDRITAKSAAPAAERKPPEIFWRSFIMRAACSAKLLVN